MARVKVKVDRGNGLQQTVVIDTDATQGATLGRDVYLNGAVAAPEAVRTWLGLGSGANIRSGYGILISGTNPQTVNVNRAAAFGWQGQHTWDLSLRAPNGSAAEPAYTFTNSPDLGAFRVGDNHYGLAIGGVQHWDMNTARSYQDLPQNIQAPASPVASELVAVAGTGTVLRSLDAGVTWSVETPATLAGVTLDDLAYSPSIGRLVGIQRGSHSPQVIYWSDDRGLTWTAASSPLASGTFDMGRLIWSSLASLFVVMNSGGSATTRIAMSSPDGNTWAATATATVSANGAVGLVETGSEIVALFNNRIAVSSNGTTWTSASSTPANFSAAPASAVFASPLGVIATLSGNANPRYSSASPWTTQTAGSGATLISGGAQAWSPTLALFATNFVNQYYSVDGIAWSAGGGAPGGTAQKTIWDAASAVFVSVGSVAGPTARIYTSADGANWTARVTTGNYIVNAVIALPATTRYPAQRIWPDSDIGGHVFELTAGVGSSTDIRSIFAVTGAIESAVPPFAAVRGFDLRAVGKGASTAAEFYFGAFNNSTTSTPLWGAVENVAQIQFTPGTAAAPGLTFFSDTNTGMYRVGADQVGFSLGGTLRLTLSTTVFTATLPWQGPAGSAGTPAFSFSGDPNTGVYNVGADQLGLAAGGALAVQVDANATAGNTRLLVYDVDNATLERVSVGAADSGGTGFKVLRIPN
jgi:hypothetical protein